MPHPWIENCFDNHTCETCEFCSIPTTDPLCIECADAINTDVCNWQEAGKDPNDIEIVGVHCFDGSDD